LVNFGVDAGCRGGKRGSFDMKILTALGIVGLAVGGAAADQVVVGYRTYMSTFPFYGC
jgi:hypothetical protein